MRILVLGAGAVGGYFGGRVVQAGAAEVAFLVRPGRKAQLDRDGLVIESPSAGDARLAVTALLADDLPRAGAWDVVLLTAKAYDLDAAIAAIRPAVGKTTAVLPLLNGLSHIDTLVAAFGTGRVLGGLAKIQATLTAEGVVRHLAPVQMVEFGERDGTMSERVQALKRVFDSAGLRADAVTDITSRMWEKLVLIGTLAIATVLMRANLGEIAAAGGQDWIDRLLERNVAIAAAHGHPVRPKALERELVPMFRSAGPAAASMLRDLEAGGRIESDHILGFLLDAARHAGVDDALHEAAYLHARAYEARRAAGRLPHR
ncbi:ketopantoate reductase family protein [Elioraea tepidiphila]|jgi:2-dehydropantoate 2-reductase|uniref:ketopantoate reductase family protein n=1 Tax=Elioraea tepidiphila TaxID=457934 RepID=UPI000362ACC6|nr:ketopantoate reductase family protein [Elioraea tepidiphila]